MGQYYKGVKIGTCETMHYLTLKEAQALALQGEKDDDGVTFEEYLTDNTTRFRFDWLDDNKTERRHDKSFCLPCPKGFGDDIKHNTITVHNTTKDKCNGINIFIPCPYSKDFNCKTSIGGAGNQKIEVLYQAIRHGQEKTIFACSRCGQQFYMDDEDILKLKEYATEYYKAYDTTDKNPDYQGNQELYNYAMDVLSKIK